MITLSLACNFNSLIGLADPGLQLEGELTYQERTDLQPYLGTHTSEIINIEEFSEGYCPSEHNMFSFNGEVTYAINGDSLIVTENNRVSSNLPYNPKMKAFCRTSPTGSVDGVELEVMDCVSFQNRHGVKTTNHRRYYDENGTPTLCFDQRTQILDLAGEPSESGSDSSLLERCVVSPGMYLVEFTNTSTENSNDSKTVCQGDFIIQNLSAENISLRYYQVYDDGNQYKEEWTYLYISLDPGEKTERDFDIQTWTDGRITINAFSKLIVVRSTPECTNLITDENISIWEEHIVQLKYPCE